ncbi:MAG: VTT domain-containing protein [Candidatus Dormibacteraceae bacterium]
MSFLEGLHGAVALILLLTLLYAEEAGVPLPFAPGEIVLVIAGLLIETRALDGWVFVPLAIVFCGAGSFTGYSWASFIGERGLEIAAARLHQEKRVAKVSARIKRARALDIAITRLIPGLRIYTSLVAGAVGVSRRRFLLGVMPATVLWVLVFTAVGFVFGIPAARFLNRIEDFAVQGALLVVLGLGTYFAVRRIPGDRLTALRRVPDVVRLGLALLVDLCIVVALVTGVEAVTLRLVGFNLVAQWAEVAILTAVVIVVYFLVTRFGFGATAGEALAGTSYRTGRQRQHRVRPVGSPRLEEARRRFRDLSDNSRLEVLNLLLDRPHTVDELLTRVSGPREEVLGHLRTLHRIGLVDPEVDGDEPHTRYQIAGPELRDAVSRLMALRATPPAAMPGLPDAGAPAAPMPNAAPPSQPAAVTSLPQPPAPKIARSPRSPS